MPSALGFGFQAGGNISPSRFCKLSITLDSTVTQATAGDQIIGISPKGTHTAPYGALDDGYAMISGESARLFMFGEVAPLTLGGTVAAGDRLKSDSDGKGVTATTGTEFGAIALEAGISGEVIQVVMVSGKLP